MSTRLPEVELYGDLVHIADTAEQFGSLLCHAAHEGSQPIRDRRIAAARQESWRNRAQTLLQRVAKMMDHGQA